MSVTELKGAEAPPSERSRWIALVVLCVGMLMIVLDQTIVNVALPSIQRDLHFSTSSLAWVVNAYLIAFGGLLLLAGRLGDLVGRKRIFLIGLAVFTAASALCGLADSQALLVGARFLQGAGGAMTSSVILGMIVTMFPEPREQAKAMGVFSFVAAGGASVGLLAGGIITQALDWHWIFFVNLPIGVLASLLAVRVVTADQGIGLRAGADLPGATLVTAALMLAVYTIVKTSEYGWGSAHTLILGAAAVAILAAFLAREATARTPLIPLRIFRSRNVSGANLVQMLMIAGIFGMFFLGAVYMQRVLGYDPLQVGLAYLPVAISIGTVSLFVAPALNMKIGPRATLLPGLVLMAIGLLLFAAAPVHADYVRASAAGDGAAGRRRRAQLPLAHDHRDVGRPAPRGGPRLRPGQHLDAGRWRAGSGRAGDTVGQSRQGRGRRRRDLGGRDRQWAAPGAAHRSRTGHRGHRHRRHGPGSGAGAGPGAGRGRRTRRRAADQRAALLRGRLTRVPARAAGGGLPALGRRRPSRLPVQIGELVRVEHGEDRDDLAVANLEHGQRILAAQ